MTMFEIIRLVLAGILIIGFVAWRLGLKSVLKEAKQKKRQQEAFAQRKARAEEARTRAQQENEARIRRTSQILKLDLQGLMQKSVQAAGLELWYLEGGVVNRGPTVLLLHGFDSRKEDWNEFAGPLLQAGLHVVAPDLPGFGQNAKAPDLGYDVTSQAKRIRAFAGALELQRFHLVGSSLGGSIAAALTYGAPDQVASLTLIEPFGVRVPYESQLDQVLERGFNPLTISTPEAYDNLLGFLFETPPAMSDAVKRHHAEEAAAHRDFYLKMWPQFRGGERAYLLDLLLPEIKVKTLAIQGLKSKVTHPATGQIIANMVRGAQVVEIPECGHLPAVEKPAETAEVFLKLIRENLPGAAAAAG